MKLLAVNAILGSAASFALLHCVGIFHPGSLWGTDQLHYYGWPSRAVFACSVVGVCTCALLPGRLSRIDIAVRRLTRFFAGLAGPIKSLIPLAAFAALAYGFRVREHTLGDSVVWFRNLKNSNDGGDGWWANAFGFDSLEHVPTNEFLDYFLHLQAYRLGNFAFGWSPADAYASLSLAAGVLYVIAAWKIAALLGATTLRRLTYVGALLSLGTLQLFFGYGESYTLVTAAAAFYVLAALGRLRGGCRPIAPLILLVVCCALHLMALSLAPSYGYLAWRRQGRSGRAMLERKSVIAGIAVIGGSIALYLYSAIYPHNLPLFTARESGTYALFSLGHGALLFNAVLLVSPLGLVWGAQGLQAVGRWETEQWFLAWAAAGTLGLIAVHNAYLGGRDWDLLSFPGMFYTLWGLTCLAHMPNGGQLLRQVRLIAVPIVALHTALWIGINADRDRALARMENLLPEANQPHHYRHFSQGFHYFSLAGHEDRAVYHFLQALSQLGPDEGDFVAKSRQYGKLLGCALVKAGRYAEAVEVFDKAFAGQERTFLYEQDLVYFNYRIQALLVQAERERVPAGAALKERAIEYGRQVITERPTADTYRLLGAALCGNGEFTAAVEAYRRSIEMQSDPQIVANIYRDLARCLEQAGRHVDAAAAKQRAERMVDD